MNLRDLHYIIAVADLRHFGHAARACNISQPTLSGQILKLEQELGITIFERNGKTVSPTAAGEQVLEHARAAIAAVDELILSARASRDPMRGPLRIGIIPTLSPYLMPFVLPKARKTMPDTPLLLVEDLTDPLLARLLAGRLDALILASDPSELPLATELLFEEPFYLVVPNSHRLARQTSVQATDIDPQSLLLLADGHCLRDQALQLCQHPQLGENAMADMRASSLTTLLHMAAAGYGITLIPALALLNADVLPKSLVALPLEGPDTSRCIRLVWRPTHPRQKAIAALGELVRASLPTELAAR
jgi:LysR family hydrogen peroxide-inducible transcriptional activator